MLLCKLNVFQRWRQIPKPFRRRRYLAFHKNLLTYSTEQCVVDYHAQILLVNSWESYVP